MCFRVVQSEFRYAYGVGAFDLKQSVQNSSLKFRNWNLSYT